MWAKHWLFWRREQNGMDFHLYSKMRLQQCLRVFIRWGQGVIHHRTTWEHLTKLHKEPPCVVATPSLKLREAQDAKTLYVSAHVLMGGTDTFCCSCNCITTMRANVLPVILKFPTTQRRKSLLPTSCVRLHSLLFYFSFPVFTSLVAKTDAFST